MNNAPMPSGFPSHGTSVDPEEYLSTCRFFVVWLICTFSTCTIAAQNGEKMQPPPFSFFLFVGSQISLILYSHLSGCFLLSIFPLPFNWNSLGFHRDASGFFHNPWNESLWRKSMKWGFWGRIEFRGWLLSKIASHSKRQPLTRTKLCI